MPAVVAGCAEGRRDAGQLGGLEAAGVVAAARVVNLDAQAVVRHVASRID